MNWEALSAIGTIFTGLIILLTVILGARQLKAATAQVDHLRRATQLEGAMEIFALTRGPRFSDAYRFVLQELPDLLNDEEFRRGALARGTDSAIHKELYILQLFEELGTYVKHGLLDGDVIYDALSGTIKESWQGLRELVRLQRQAWEDERFYENFEYVYNEVMRFRPE